MEEAKIINKSNRIVYADILKILACFAVIMIHITALNYSNTEYEFQWEVFNFFDSISRWSVPIFVMVSGVFLLNPSKNITIKTVWKKYIGRMLIIYLFWSTFYSLITNNATNGSNEKIIEDIVFGYYHLWYLIMLLGLYMVTPFLRKIAEDKKLTQYFISLWFIFQVCGFCSRFVPDIKVYIDRFLETKMYLYFMFGYTGYYLLGHYLNKYEAEFSNIKRAIIYILGIAGTVVTILGTRELRGTQNFVILYEYLMPNVMAMSIAIFVFIKRAIEKRNIKPRTENFIRWLVKYSLVIYIIHPLIMKTLNYYGISTLKNNPIQMVLIIFVLVYFISLIISIILKKIPIIRIVT